VFRRFQHIEKENEMKTHTLNIGSIFILLALVFVPLSGRAHAQEPALELEFLTKFETSESLGFSPDDVTYSPPHAHLFITSNGPKKTGIFEVTLQGELVRHIPFFQTPVGSCCAGFSITRAHSGPKVGHFFLADLIDQTTLVHEFDSNWNWINAFPVTASYPDSHPGDGIAFNTISKNIVVAEEVHGELIEVTTGGQFLRTFPAVNVQGITYNEPTGTYFGVHVSRWLREISSDGIILRQFDLTPYGIKQPVGVASGQGKLFIADELDVANTGGYIYIFRSPKKEK
jgi:hypothetical protein